ncbi:cell wall metabolism sensor histidine kinase WalK [Eggerthella sp. YY7918]|uniref:sensor histidine kinase n=1 Tax=Eggerthella sp. (strain YY7918) TaxID=502558 RepID=UPI00021710AF|nr:HAMP domain-containing sensor histidine kinase [Eggerthella sp. YY7918]BAK43476.1 signal transduction histidine kinase [Eggerthella sp. YY7918]
MTERALIRRELAKQTVLLFLVFTLLFALLGVGIYSILSAGIYQNADETLRSLETSEDLLTFEADPGGAAAITFDDTSGTTPDETEVDDLSYSLQKSIVDVDPQFITLVRNAQGDLVNTVGLYASYPAFLREVPFDAQDLDHIYQTSAGGHAYRGITYRLDDNGSPLFVQVLVNVDSELAILDSFARTLVLYLAVAALVSAAAGYLLSRRTLKPIVENWRAQTEFVQNASHELRTPLAVMQTTSELLLDHPQSRIVDRFEDVNVITSETKRLSHLVDDLMALSLDDAGRTSLARTEVYVGTLLRETAGAYEDFAALQDKRIEVDASDEVVVRADADKLRQLLNILVDNALKYTEAGDIVRLSAQFKGSKCVLRVADTGCGIDPADRAHVFERFYRADKARSRETGGHGLGLSLAKGIVEAHSGTITLEGNEPHGTVAVVTLPIN